MFIKNYMSIQNTNIQSAIFLVFFTSETTFVFQLGAYALGSRFEYPCCNGVSVSRGNNSEQSKRGIDSRLGFDIVQKYN